MGGAGTELIDKSDVRYALSASVLLDELRMGVTSKGLELHAFAPDYGEADGANDGSMSRNVLMGVEERNTAGPLLHNEEEVNSIAKEVQATTCVGAGANEVVFRQALSKEGVLHLALHAYSSDEPGRSGLVFATMDTLKSG